MNARFVKMTWLVVVWVALWGSVSVANLASGVVVAGVLVTAFPTADPSRERGRLRPLALLRFTGYFVRKLVEANVVVAWEIVTPGTERVSEAIVAIEVGDDVSDTVLAVLSAAIGLTPGTLVVDIRRDPAVIYVHVLHLHSRDQVELDLLQMEVRVVRALGSDGAVADVEGRLAAKLAAVGNREEVR